MEDMSPSSKSLLSLHTFVLALVIFDGLRKIYHLMNIFCLSSWENRQQYVDSIRSLRMSELICHERMTALRAGMASVIPVHILPIMTSMDSDVRICGLPEIDLDFLMVNMIYSPK